MKFEKTHIPDVYKIIPQVHKDPRGEFLETYRLSEFAEASIDLPFVQENHASSRQGVLRGLHYQIQQAQGKLVRVICGEIFDVAVDLRSSAPSFGRFVGVRLSAENKFQLWVPPGFAHGYYVLSEWAEVSYKVTDYYAPQWERTLLWNDSTIGIDWPLLKDHPPLLSDNDRQGTPFNKADKYG